MLTVNEIAEICDTTPVKVATRGNQYGWDSELLFFTYRSRNAFLRDRNTAFPEFDVHKSKASNKPSFDRQTFCYRDDFSEKCRHYSSCQDHRILEKSHHTRYRKDGSCYCGEPVLLRAKAMSSIATQARLSI
jgi:hypothetical protein